MKGSKIRTVGVRGAQPACGTRGPARLEAVSGAEMLERFVAWEETAVGDRRRRTRARVWESAQTRESARLMCCLLAFLSVTERIIRGLLSSQWLH